MPCEECEKVNAVLHIRVTNLEKVVDRVSKAVESIDESLKILARLEVHHEQTRSSLERAFDGLDACSARIRSLEDSCVRAADCKERCVRIDDKVKRIEIEMPTIKLIRGWVLTGVVAVVALVGTAVVNLVMRR